jgi:hypothetical protein
MRVRIPPYAQIYFINKGLIKMKVYIVLTTSESIESKFTIVTKVFSKKESAEKLISELPKSFFLDEEFFNTYHFIKEHEVSE